MKIFTANATVFASPSCSDGSRSQEHSLLARARTCTYLHAPVGASTGAQVREQRTLAVRIMLIPLMPRHILINDFL